jgi:hypothetical protein
VLFVIAVAFISYSEIKAEFDVVAANAAGWPGEIAVPVLCDDARGVAEADYLREIGGSDHCWYAMSKVPAALP